MRWPPTGRPSRLRTTFSLFRVAAWKLTVHNDALCEMDSSFDGCPTACTRQERDQRRGCPECPVTQMYEQLKEEIREELGRVAVDAGYRPGHRWPWTLEKLLTDVGVVAMVDASVDGKGYRGEWPVSLKRLVMTLREERNSLRRSKDAELKRELESRHGR